MKTNPSLKIMPAEPRTRTQVENLVAEMASAKNNERLIAASMDAEILAIREKYQPNLESLTSRMDALSAAVQVWAEAHPEEFGRLKSIEFPAGVIGFRTGSPKLKTLPKWTFDRVLDALRRTDAWRGYIRVKEEVDKEALLGAKLPSAELRGMGLQILQEESFYIAPRLADTPTRQVTGRRAA